MTLCRIAYLCWNRTHMAKRMRVCREHHRPDNKCMAMATPGSDRHHLEAFTRQRKVNRELGLCGCGAQPDPGYRTCANCRVWASWLKRCQRKPELRLVYRTRQAVGAERAARNRGSRARAQNSHADEPRIHGRRKAAPRGLARRRTIAPGACLPPVQRRARPPRAGALLLRQAGHFAPRRVM